MARKSRSWIKERKRDHFYLKAKKEGYRSRAVYKLIEIDKRFKILRIGYKVVDLGAAPGGWLQYSAEVVGNKGFVIGVDIREISPLPYENVETIKMNVFDKELEKVILEKAKSKVDVVLSDLSPNISGVWEVDVARNVEMCNKVIDLSNKVLRKNGKLIVKVFEGTDTNMVLKRLREKFSYVRLFKPSASRKGSSEMYAVCLGFRG